MLKSAFSQIVLLIVFILLSGCGGTPDVQVNELSRNTVSYDETIHINNCGGKADSEQTASHSFATTIEGGAGLSAGYKLIVEGNVSAKYGQYSNVSKSQKLTAPPETNMEFVLQLLTSTWVSFCRKSNKQFWEIQEQLLSLELVERTL